MTPAMTDIELLRACLIEACGDDAPDWETGDGWPIGHILAAAIDAMDEARAAMQTYRAERAAAEAEAQSSDDSHAEDEDGARAA